MNKNNPIFLDFRENPQIHIICPSCEKKDKHMRIDEIETSFSMLLGMYTIVFDVHSTCEYCGCTANYVHSVQVADSRLLPIEYTDVWTRALEDIDNE